MSIGPGALRPIYLMPGTLHCATEPSLITTILGSCIALCLWDSARRIGGMNHYVLPHRIGTDDSSRYGEMAIERLFDALVTQGSAMRDLRAKLFGGATVLAGSDAGDSIGHRNRQLAEVMLRQRRIPVTAQRTGGRHGLLIRFNTMSGNVEVRRVAPDVHGWSDIADSREAPQALC